MKCLLIVYRKIDDPEHSTIVVARDDVDRLIAERRLPADIKDGLVWTSLLSAECAVILKSATGNVVECV